jgi:hypothetical protein
MRVIHVPSPSALLRQQIKTISDDLSTVIERTYAALGDIDGYEDLPISVKKDIVDSISISERLWFQSIVDGEFPDNESLKTFQDFGRRRVHQAFLCSRCCEPSGWRLERFGAHAPIWAASTTSCATNCCSRFRRT